MSKGSALTPRDPDEADLRATIAELEDALAGAEAAGEDATVYLGLAGVALHRLWEEYGDETALARGARFSVAAAGAIGVDDGAAEDEVRRDVLDNAVVVLVDAALTLDQDRSEIGRAHV